MPIADESVMVPATYVHVMEPPVLSYTPPFMTNNEGSDAAVKVTLLSSMVPVIVRTVRPPPEEDTSKRPVLLSILKGRVTVESVFDCPRATVILFPSRIASAIYYAV